MADDLNFKKKDVGARGHRSGTLWEDLDLVGVLLKYFEILPTSP